MCKMYAVVYGDAYCDILYFSDISKAKFKLYIQTLALTCDHTFYPCLFEYTDIQGVFKKTGNAWMIVPEKIDIATFEEIQMNVRLIDSMLVHLKGVQ